MACDAAHEEKGDSTTPSKSESRQHHHEVIIIHNDTTSTTTTTGAVAVAAPARTILAAQQDNVIRTRIDRFIAGYGLTPMGKAVALNWIQVGEYSGLLLRVAATYLTSGVSAIADPYYYKTVSS